MSEARWYTIKEVAERLHVSHDTVSRMVAREELPAIRVSDRLIRIPAPALHRFESGTPVVRRGVVRRRVRDGIEIGTGERPPDPGGRDPLSPVDLASQELDDYVSRLLELLERYGVVITKPGVGRLAEILEADDGSLSFEVIGSLPDGRQPARSTIEFRERFQPIDGARFERVGYEYELLDHERNFRRAFHVHDREWFERYHMVVVHTHCERPVKHGACKHYEGSPIRDGYAGVLALIDVWMDEPPDCTKRHCLE